MIVKEVMVIKNIAFLCYVLYFACKIFNVDIKLLYS